jgi:hypothetical protein
MDDALPATATNWVLLVDGHTSVHRDEGGALAALRVNYAEGDDVPDAELIQFVRGQGIRVELTEHERPTPGADTAVPRTGN